MRAATLVPPHITKEIRALLPVWIASVLGMCAAAATSDRHGMTLDVIVYLLGSVLLGAQSLGHEYTHHTLSTLLAQPIHRGRLLLRKAVVLVPMLAALGAIAWVVVFSGREFHDDFDWRRPAVAVMPVLCSVLVAPCLTMLCRSPLAGAVFASSLPGVAMVSGQLVGIALYGTGYQALDQFTARFWSISMFVVYAVSAVSSWRLFMRLEAIDGRGSEIASPPLLRTQPVTRRWQPMRVLVRKELHLQHLSFVVASFFVIGWSVAAVLKNLVPAWQWFPLAPLTIVYMTLLSVLIGSLSSAEERQCGTLEWQLLLPLPAWQQWAVKLVVALGLALLLGVSLPALLVSIDPSIDDPLSPLAFERIALAVVLLTTVSVYVSSLSGSGVKAVVGTAAVVSGAILLLSYTSWRVWLTAAEWNGMAQVAALAAFVALLQWLAFLNHRSVARRY